MADEMVHDLNGINKEVLPAGNGGAKCGDAGDRVLIPGLGRSPGEGNGKPLQDSCLGNPMDREIWWVTVHGFTKESDMT